VGAGRGTAGPGCRPSPPARTGWWCPSTPSPGRRRRSPPPRPVPTAGSTGPIRWGRPPPTGGPVSRRRGRGRADPRPGRLRRGRWRLGGSTPSPSWRWPAGTGAPRGGRRRSGSRTASPPRGPGRCADSRGRRRAR
jgi:hypothetical protein